MNKQNNLNSGTTFTRHNAGVTAKKLIWVVSIVVALFLLIDFRYLRYDDWNNSCHIKIRFSLMEWNNTNIKKGLSALRYGAPDWYAKTCRNVKVINTGRGCGGFQGGCFNLNPGEITVSAANEQFIAWTSAVIAHETCHDLQMKTSRPFSEDECYNVSDDILKRLVIPWNPS